MAFALRPGFLAGGQRRHHVRLRLTAASRSCFSPATRPSCLAGPLSRAGSPRKGGCNAAAGNAEEAFTEAVTADALIPAELQSPSSPRRSARHSTCSQSLVRTTTQPPIHAHPSQGRQLPLIPADANVAALSSSIMGTLGSGKSRPEAAHPEADLPRGRQLRRRGTRRGAWNPNRLYFSGLDQEMTGKERLVAPSGASSNIGTHSDLSTFARLEKFLRRLDSFRRQKVAA